MAKIGSYATMLGNAEAYVFKAKIGYNVFTWYKGRINGGWYAPTLKEARVLADAHVSDLGGK